ncbi:hypothetical protein FisN_4Lu489 [Fistulifera solaris]|uniref:Essential protein Yae1 N-terminal domain-containing protein n=1 Tax=Fistulifera solaris TaxID=1519565 RepID=A0A1Z5JZ33_FISSO|nr:hypothetical protein FisN_4Lu489 [Fistulifera solaris]|eukprot:GAX19274.1 hypothetical protein FisN_4Lu489 [Fistulifera solaris]
MATWKSESDEDEFFGAPVENDGQRICADGFEVQSGLAQAEACALKERHKVIGYHETYDAAKESALQSGFEAGYRDHFDVSRRIGVMIGRLVMDAKRRGGQDQYSHSIESSKHTQALLLTKDHLMSIGSVQGDTNAKDATIKEKNSLEELEVKLSIISESDCA